MKHGSVGSADRGLSTPPMHTCPCFAHEATPTPSSSRISLVCQKRQLNKAKRGIYPVRSQSCRITYSGTPTHLLLQLDGSAHKEVRPGNSRMCERRTLFHVKRHSNTALHMSRTSIMGDESTHVSRETAISRGTPRSLDRYRELARPIGEHRREGVQCRLGDRNAF